MKTLEQLTTEANTKKDALGLDLDNDSAAGIWTKLRDLAVFLIYTFQSIWYNEKGQLESELQRKRYGRLDWYASEAKKFQYGHQLVFINETGELIYAIDSEIDRIIAQASVSEGSNGVLTLKVAKLDAGELVPLIADELTAFKAYIQQIKVGGTAINIISITGDEMSLGGIVYFDASFTEADISDAASTALIGYRDSIDFNGIVLVNDIVAALRAVPGIIDFYPSKVEMTAAGAQPLEIKRDYLLASGYFNFNESPIAGITFTPQQAV